MKRLNRIILTVILFSIILSLTATSFADGDSNAIEESKSLLVLKDRVNPNPEKAEELLIPLAESGNAEAQYYLGYIYYLFDQCKDYDKAFELFQVAANNGNEKANAYLARASFRGEGTAKDENKAQEYAKAAVDAGFMNMSDEELDFDGEYALAWMYSKGIGVPQDYDKTLDKYLKSADAGNIAAMHSIGYMYDVGQGVVQDYSKAMEWYLKAANAGYAGSMYNVGYLYLYGQGVEKSGKTALEWFEKAAELGFVNAMNNIGTMYNRGDGIEQNFEKAMEWYLKAANAGDAGTMQTIGEMYENGRGVAQSMTTANEWYAKAKAAGYNG